MQPLPTNVESEFNFLLTDFDINLRRSPDSTVLEWAIIYPYTFPFITYCITGLKWICKVYKYSIFYFILFYSI